MTETKSVTERVKVRVHVRCTDLVKQIDQNTIEFEMPVRFGAVFDQGFIDYLEEWHDKRDCVEMVERAEELLFNLQVQKMMNVRRCG